MRPHPKASEQVRTSTNHIVDRRKGSPTADEQRILSFPGRQLTPQCYLLANSSYTSVQDQA